ncbi:MAG TPA: DUF6152 family protein [Bryobacteraceae bacterium]
MKTLSTLALGIGLLGIPLLAHHSFQAEYDQGKPLTLVGKITKVMADNPHGWIYLDAKNDQGRVVNWALELPAPNVLRRNGFDRNIYETLMNSGEEVTVTAYASKDGSKHAWAGGLTRSDGQTVIPLGGIPGQGRGRGGARGQQQ